ncbi:CDP-diacylglycerol diphosphatase [Rhizobium sp. BR 315]|uniref:CDP-diacylglycerol diphosphatase n=1 Tax=Rhizobium sp. BR 315 TaxID=3040014 RepID=UPI003D3558BA
MENLSGLRVSKRRYRLALLSTGILLVVALGSSFASRAALGLAVESCRLNSTLTGAAFPCLKVVQKPQPLASYAILREPTHKERTILTPLADVSGIEDKRLLVPDAPNYFLDAWNEWAIVMGDHANRDPWRDAALGINAASNRTQDHLHIHMGCVSSSLKLALNSHAADIGAEKFQRINTKSAWRSFWARFVSADQFENINPFQLVADDVPHARADMENVTIGIVGTSRQDGQQGLYLLAEIFGDNDSYGSAEELVDPKCRL